MILNQTFQPADLGGVAFLILLEGLLSADNALVLAIMVRHLPKEQQKKALLYGLGGAFVFRLIAILLVKSIIKLWWLQAIGAIYLFYLPIKHFWMHGSNKEIKSKQGGFWQTVVAVELADIAFAIDSVLAGVAAFPHPDKVWVVYLGAIFGIILLRFAASFFIKLLERFPLLDHVAYCLVGWVGIKLAFMALHNLGVALPNVLPFHTGEMSDLIFWIGMGLIAGVGTFLAVRYQRTNGTPEDVLEEKELENMIQEGLEEFE